MRGHFKHPPASCLLPPTSCLLSPTPSTSYLLPPTTHFLCPTSHLLLPTCHTFHLRLPVVAALEFGYELAHLLEQLPPCGEG